MNRILQFCILYFGLVPAFTGCVDEIDLRRPDIPDSGLMVQGKVLYGNPGRVTASVFELYTLSTNVPKPLGGAKVILEDDLGHSIQLLSSEAGSFFRELSPDDSNFPLAIGRQYRLNVSLPNGRMYQSAWEAILPSPPMDSISAKLVLDEYFDNRGILKVDTFAQFELSSSLRIPNTLEPVRFRWEIDQGFKLTDDLGKTCFVVRKLLDANVLAFSGRNTGQNHLENYFLTRTPVDYRFSEGFYLLIYQQGISENAYGYFDELRQLLSKKGTLFDPPAGQIRSNIASLNDPEELTYGFFYAAKQDTAWLYISPEMAGDPRVYCPLPPNFSGFSNKNSCDDCLCELGAQLERPDWWEF
ncbi:MAG: DUF4249 domain-containing protein [Saprospiraceae bacterium]